MFRITGTGLGAIKSTPLQINGVLYFTVPDHVWAVDARSGRELWHYQWQTTGGNHLGNRGVAVHEDSLYFETPDCFLISLNLKDGKERWRRQICDIDSSTTRQWRRPSSRIASSSASAATTSTFPGYIQSHHPESGEMQWRWYTVPMNPGDVGHGHLAERGNGPAWRRDDVAADHLRSGAQLHLRHDWQSATRHRAQEPAGRQPLHRVDRRGECRHGQDCLALPVLPA